jgi:hypothetical protein
MILILTFEDLPPMPRNRSHMLTAKGGRPMNIKTPLCREFEKDLHNRLLKFQSSIDYFNSCYVSNKHYIVAEYYIYTPEELLFTKQGAISSRSVDVDAHKVMTDVVFNCIGLDDKIMRDCRIITPVSHDGKHNYILILKLETKWNLKNTYTSTQNTITQMNENLMSSVLL